MGSNVQKFKRFKKFKGTTQQYLKAVGVSTLDLEAFERLRHLNLLNF
jgi:hypothetical protein